MKRMEASEGCSQGAKSLGGALVAAVGSGSLGHVQALLQMGADPDFADGRGLTPLMHSVELPSLEILLLLAPLSKQEARSADGETALLMAARRGSHEAAMALGRRAALVASPHGSTPLMEAAKRGRWRTVGGLLAWSDPLAADDDGWDAMMRASGAGCAESAKLLMSVSDLGRSCERGTAADLAEGAGHARLAKEIRLWASARAEREEVARAVAKREGQGTAPMRL